MSISRTPPLLAMVALTTIAGCFAPRPAQQGPPPNAPLVALSPEQLTSPSGEMSARFPKGWITLDADEIHAPQIFAIACNPSYTLSVIFSETPMDDQMRGRFERDGARGLLGLSFERRQRRSNGRAIMLDDLEDFAIGKRRFMAYTYTTDSSHTTTRVAVFFTPRNLYECAITQLPFGDTEIPDASTMAYVHQVILGGIEW